MERRGFYSAFTWGIFFDESTKSASADVISPKSLYVDRSTPLMMSPKRNSQNIMNETILKNNPASKHTPATT